MKKFTFKASSKSLILTIILCTFLSFNSKAIVFNAITSGKWSDKTIWSTSTVPGALDSVKITSKNTVYLDITNAFANTIFIDYGATLAGGGYVLNVKGDWTNYGVFTHNSTTVIFSGTSVQAINANGQQSPNIFYNLVMNKAPGSYVRIGPGQTLTIEKSLMVNSNFINIDQSSEINITNPDPGAISFQKGSGIQGRVRRAVNPSGTYIFPYILKGFLVQYCTVSLNNLVGINNIAVNFTATVSGTPALSKYCVPIKDQLNGGYWSVLPNTTPQGGTFDIRLTDQSHSNGASAVDAYIVISRPQSYTAPSPWALNGMHSNNTQKDSSGIVTAVCSGISFRNFGEFNIGKSLSQIPSDTLFAAITKTDAICNQATSGSAIAIPVNGTKPFTFLWKTNPVQTTALALNLPIGKDTVIVTDYYGCKTLAVADILFKTPPSANFYSSTPSGTTISFTVGTPTQHAGYYWDFGDNTSATGNNPSHTFTKAGGYLVSLKAMDSLVVYCQSSSSRFITVGTGGCNTHADFNPSQSPNKDFTFYNTSIGKNLKYFWDFGNGTSSFASNPASYFYPSSGAYTVCLTVMDTLLNCQSTTCHDVKVDNTTDCGTNFLFFTDSGSNKVQFDGRSVNTAGSYSWTFGNGDYSNEANPVYTYSTPGYYDVCLTTHDSLVFGCQSQHCEKVHVGKGDCNAAFSVLAEANSLKVNFLDASLGTISGWHWDFGDGNMSNLQNPVYTFAKAGFYEICLTDSGALGCQSSFCKTIHIGNGDCEADFSTFTDASSLFAAFKDASLGSPTAWSWEFGDGQHSIEQSPVHTYAKNGIYSVCLNTLSANGCINQRCKDIVMGPMGADCQADFNYFEKNKIASFINKSLGTATSYFWDFGDQSTDTQKSPKHIYAKDGYYMVTLSIYDVASKCFNTTYKNITIGSQAAALGCEAKFTSMVDSTTKTVRFNDKSFGNPVSWFWTFDSLGTITSPLQNPVITFPKSGFYQACLTIKSANGSTSTDCSVIGIGQSGLYADFSYEQNGKYAFKNAATYPVSFYGSAYGKPSKWKWAFGDKSVDSLRIDVTHNYQGTGSYNACLAISDPNTNLTSNHCKIVKVSDVQGLKNVSGAGFNLNVYPNPMTGQGVVSYFLETSTQVQISLFDLYGKRLKTLAGSEQQGYIHQAIDISDLGLAQGMYLIQLSANGKLIYKPVVIGK